MTTQAELQALASTGGAEAVFQYALNNGLSLDQLAQIGGVSTAEMANLAASQGIDPKQLSQIGYVDPAQPTPLSMPDIGSIGDAAAFNRMSDADVQALLRDMNTGAIDPRVGAWQLSQAQIGLNELARISGQSEDAIRQAAMQNGIRFAEGVNGGYGNPDAVVDDWIQTGGLFSGYGHTREGMDQLARELGQGSLQLQGKNTYGYVGPNGPDYIMDLSRMTMDGGWDPVGLKPMNGDFSASTHPGDAYLRSLGRIGADSRMVGGSTGGSTGGGSTGGGSTWDSSGNYTGGGNPYMYGGMGGFQGHGGTQYRISPSSPFLDRSKSGGWYNYGDMSTPGMYDPLQPFGGGLPPIAPHAPMMGGLTAALQEATPL